MDTLQLKRMMFHHMKSTFVDVCALDELPITYHRPAAIIVNTDTSKERGTHWTAIYLHVNGSGEYFDSFAKEPSEAIKKFMNKNAPSGWLMNLRVVQGVFSTLCGGYCGIYLEARHRNRELTLKTLIDRIFPHTNTKNNDQAVHRTLRKHYGIYLPITDVSLLLDIINK